MNHSFMLTIKVPVTIQPTEGGYQAIPTGLPDLAAGTLTCEACGCNADGNDKDCPQ